MEKYRPPDVLEGVWGNTRNCQNCQKPSWFRACKCQKTNNEHVRNLGLAWGGVICTGSRKEQPAGPEAHQGTRPGASHPTLPGFVSLGSSGTLHVTRPARALLGESPAPRSRHHPTMSPNGFPYFSQIHLFLILYEGIFAPCTEGCQHQGGLLKLRGKENLHESK